MVRRVFAAALAGVGLALAAPAAPAQEAAGTNNQTPEINRLLAKSWEDNKIRPSAHCSDYEFIRRVTLDLIGRIASADEVKAFAADGSPDKCAKLVRKLLGPEYVEEYATHWANTWTVWLMTRQGVNPKYHEVMNNWLYDQFKKNVHHDELVTKLLTASGKSHDDKDPAAANPAVNYIISHMGEKSKAGDEGAYEAFPLTSRTTKLFLGLQTQCIQCHDHPFNPEWKQDQFWSLNVFFRQIERDKTPTPFEVRRRDRMNPVTEVTLRDDTKLNPSGMVAFERRNGLLKYTKAAFLDNDPKKTPVNTAKPRREELARLLVNHDQFAKEYVNRIWAHLFGRGMNEQKTFDDFGEHNKVVHPELMDFLAKEFIAYKYDPKQLMYWVCTSDAYSLSCVANPTNAKEEHEPYFSRMLLKALPPEVLFESLMVATTPESKKLSAEERAKIREEKAKARETWMAKLVRNFGDDEGNEVNFNGTIIQALLMMNGKDINDSVTGGKAGDKTIVGMIAAKAKSPDAIYNELFLTALNRRPTARELRDLETIRHGGTPDSAKGPKVPAVGAKPVTPKGGKPPAAAPAAPDPKDVASLADAHAFYEDVFWGLLNTNEFILNH